MRQYTRDSRPRKGNVPASLFEGTSNDDGRTIEPLPDAFGATVFGLDCGSLDDATATALREAWRKYRVLIFRDVVKSDDDLVTLGRCFGDRDR